MVRVPGYRVAVTTSPEETRVGPYRLLAHIGEGGMGVVHLAQGPDGRRVALKVLRPHIVGDAEARERLAQEVSSLQRLSSPRIAEILDADPHGPVPYVVTRYVPGLSLYHHVAEEGPIEGPALMHFASALAEALSAVHAGGVLHRDIKPTNVLMEGRWPVLIDFGLARVAEDPRLTQTGFLLGTPGYLAPEILYGDEATAASDVHAWAATVVFAATGRPPYGTGPTMAIMDRVRRGEHDLSGIPGPIDQLLAASLSADPAERPAVRRLVAWLQEHAEPAIVRPTPVPDLWTMPFVAHARPDAEERAEDGHLDAAADTDRVPLREAGPYQQPAPPTVVTDLPADARVQEPSTVVLPVVEPSPPVQQPVPQPVPQPVQQPAYDVPMRQVQPLQRPPEQHQPQAWTPPPQPRQSSRAQQVLQLLGLGALTSATVAYAPYLGAALVAVVVLALRTASVTRQRHGRRRMIRGRARWYDVPTTTLSSPGYLLLASFGTVALVLVAGVVGLALFSLGYLVGRPVEVGMVMAGVAFTPALWWGPGSGRVREMTRGFVVRTARSEFGGWFVAAMSLLGTAVLLGLLFNGGPNWAPALHAPWR